MLFYSFSLFFVFFSPDMRRGFCYRKFENDRCFDPSSMNMTRSECCCSLSVAWGGVHCEVCPNPLEGNLPLSLSAIYKKHKNFI